MNSREGHINYWITQMKALNILPRLFQFVPGTPKRCCAGAGHWRSFALARKLTWSFMDPTLGLWTQTPASWGLRNNHHREKAEASIITLHCPAHPIFFSPQPKAPRGTGSCKMSPGGRPRPPIQLYPDLQPELTWRPCTNKEEGG